MKLVQPDLQKGGRRNNYIALLGPWLLLLAFAGGIAALFGVVTTYGGGVSSGYDPKALFYCDSNGNIRYQYSNRYYNDHSPYWDGNLFLSVTMGFHGLSFVQARAIDLCFDAIVGRGSQVLAALATYPIFRRAVLRSMEVREFSIALLIPFFMERLSWNSVWSMIWNMRSTRHSTPSPDATAQRRRRVRVDWRVILIILTSCYIVALPTLLSAMTSYQASSAPFIPTNGESEYLSAEMLKVPNYIIKDGERVGLWPDYNVWNETDERIGAACLGYSRAQSDARILWNDFWRPYLSDTTHLAENGRKPKQEKGAAEKLRFSDFRDSLPLEAYVTDPNDPPLWSYTIAPRNVTYANITKLEYTFPSTVYMEMRSNITIGNETYDLEEPLKVLTNRNEYRSGYDTATLFAIGNETWDPYTIEDDGKCLPSSGYIWGFSSLMLFTFCMLTVVVAILLMALHFDAYCNSSADRYRLYLSPYRDVLDLAAELRTHYGGTEVDSMPAKALDKAMAENPTIVGLETEALHTARMARWRQQSNGTSRTSPWYKIRKRSTAVHPDPVDAEESLMSMGFHEQSPEIEMGKVPPKVVTRGSSSSTC